MAVTALSVDRPPSLITWSQAAAQKSTKNMQLVGKEQFTLFIQSLKYSDYLFCLSYCTPVLVHYSFDVVNLTRCGLIFSIYLISIRQQNEIAQFYNTKVLIWSDHKIVLDHWIFAPNSPRENGSTCLVLAFVSPSVHQSVCPFVVRHMYKQMGKE